jgi:hypothetical protein
MEGRPSFASIEGGRVRRVRMGMMGRMGGMLRVQISGLRRGVTVRAIVV